MTQSAKLSYQTPNPMKKKVVIALLAVLIGHSVVLWGVSQMKVPELPAIEKEPIKVRLVKIKEDVPPPPPPPPKPKKEPVKPKEVKIVKKAEPPPLAKEIKKIEKTKAEAPKVVNEAVITPPTPSVVISTTTGTNKTVVNTTPTPDPAPRTPTPAPTSSPKPPASPTKTGTVGSGGIEWLKSPRFELTASELKDGCSINVGIQANEKGKVTSVIVNSTTCSKSLTNKVTRAVKYASFKPYVENGVAHSIMANQPFNLTLNKPKQ